MLSIPFALNRISESMGRIPCAYFACMLFDGIRRKARSASAIKESYSALPGA